MKDGTYVVVTRYIRPQDSRIVRHVYTGPEGEGWPTRSRALTAVKRHVREGNEFYGPSFDDALQSGALEVTAVKTVAL